MNYRYIFGPVLSRRLGVSLGVDIVPHKICTFDCVYCECGRTVEYAPERREFYNAAGITAELDKIMETRPDLDYITFSGGGEPTLNLSIGKIIGHIKESYPGYRLALLTNSSLLNVPGVIDEIKNCDTILPSLDAVSQQVFEKINRPVSGILVGSIIDGIIRLRESVKAEIWVEVLVVPGINDTDNELALLKETLERIAPHRIQLNTLDRPGAEEWIRPSCIEDLDRIKDFMSPLNAEIVGGTVHIAAVYGADANIDKIMSILRRRPSTIEDLVEGIKADSDDVKTCLHELEKCGKIIREKKNRGEFFKIKNG